MSNKHIAADISSLNIKSFQRDYLNAARTTQTAASPKEAEFGSSKILFDHVATSFPGGAASESNNAIIHPGGMIKLFL